jgi:streptogramin lyase
MTHTYRALWFTVAFLVCGGVAEAQFPPAINQYAIPTASSDPGQICLGPDGALWFTEIYGNKIARITTSGAFVEYPLPQQSQTYIGPVGIAAGPDGAIWFTSYLDVIGRITTAGVVTEFHTPTSLSTPEGIVAGPDGALWFTESAGARIGRATTDGTITEYALPGTSFPSGDIIAGPDGALWFTESGVNGIGRITTAGVIAEFALPSMSGAEAITAGPDGALWFTDFGNRIGRITMAGTVTEYEVPTPASNPTGISAGADGALWFAEQASNKLGRITTDGSVTEFSLPAPSGGTTSMTAGPDGALWLAEPGSNQIGQAFPAPVITEYLMPSPNGTPQDIVAGPDGALWFTILGGNKIGRITAAGVNTEYVLPSLNAFGITAGPDGALWFTSDTGNQIGRITTAGAVTEYPIPTPASAPTSITTGPDGALWFTEDIGNAIGRITTAGVITEYPVPTPDSVPWDITPGPDGALWFTESLTSKIGRISTQGVISEFVAPSGANGITAGPDGALWFTGNDKIGRITTAGAVTEYAVPTSQSTLSGIAAGSDGALWFTELTGNKIGRITTAGEVTEYTLPLVGSQPLNIAAGPGGTLWFTQFSTQSIGEVSLPLAQPPTQLVPVTPCRVMDTRNGNALLGGPFIAATATRTIPVLASPCGVPGNASAYSVNITAVPKTGTLGYLTVWPTGQEQPLVSTLNSLDGSVRANASIVPAGAGGTINVFSTDDTDLVIDINGYYVPPAPNSLQFYPLPPCRVLDTRTAEGTFGGPAITGGGSRSFPIPSSSCGAPASSAAYSFNVTAVPHGSLGYLTIWPEGQMQPGVSTLNSIDGSVTANAAIVQAGSDGVVNFFATDTTDLVVDLNGYFGAPAAGGLNFYTLNPCRVVDTRNASGPFGGPAVSAGATSAYPLALGSCKLPVFPVAQSYSLNMTVIPQGPLGYLTTWASGLTQPVVSTLDAPEGQVLANGAIVPAGLFGSINVFATDATQVIIDTSGFFGP